MLKIIFITISTTNIFAIGKKLKMCEFFSEICFSKMFYIFLYETVSKLFEIFQFFKMFNIFNLFKTISGIFQIFKMFEIFKIHIFISEKSRRIDARNYNIANVLC